MLTYKGKPISRELTAKSRSLIKKSHEYGAYGYAYISFETDHFADALKSSKGSIKSSPGAVSLAANSSITNEQGSISTHTIKQFSLAYRHLNVQKGHTYVASSLPI